MRILVFCSDLLPYPGLPTTGGGLRCWQLIQSLRGKGHDVIASMPLFTFLARKFADAIPPDVRANAWDHNNQDALVERHRPDAVLLTSSWTVDHLHGAHPGVLRLLDLNGPLVLEAHYQRQGELGPLIQAKIERLRRADFVMVAGQRQRHYFLPYLLQAGFSVEELDCVPVIPPSRPSARPARVPPHRLDLVAGGGFYPWQDPYTALTTVARTLTEWAAEGQSDVRLRLFGGPHHLAGTGDTERFLHFRQQVEHPPVVTFHDFLPHADLIDTYRRASAAVELHARHLERELAMTTRTIDALWCGLPVLYNNYGELSEAIREYDAGWTVDPGDEQRIVAVLTEMRNDPAAVERKAAGAARLVADRFTEERTIEPLAAYLANPAPRPRPPVSQETPRRPLWRRIASRCRRAILGRR